MNQVTPLTRRRAIFAVLLALAGVGFFLWLKAEHVPAVPIQTAQAFIDYLHANNYESASALTMRNGYTGKTPDELVVASRRQLCKLTRRVGTFPFQSNGNRLRRWLSGREVEMPEVQVEFVGDCLFGVTLRHVGGGQWKVYNFASHAG
jgi:hypothetical protein